jgi:hypothetical protein
MADKTTKPSRMRRHGEVATCFVLGIVVAIVTTRSTDNDPALTVATAAGFVALFLTQYRLELRNHHNQRANSARDGRTGPDGRRPNGPSTPAGAPTPR